MELQLTKVVLTNSAYVIMWISLQQKMDEITIKTLKTENDHLKEKNDELRKREEYNFARLDKYFEEYNDCLDKM